MAQTILATEYKQRGRGCLGHGTDDVNVSATPRVWSRCGNNPHAKEYMEKNKGTGTLWMSMDANRNVRSRGVWVGACCV